MKISIGGSIWKGHRQKQEDCFSAYTLKEQLPEIDTVYQTETERYVHVGVLCDGMGGEGNGSICSRQAVQAFANAFAEAGAYNSMWLQRLITATYAANGGVYEYKYTTRTEETNSGATLVATVISEETLHFVSVGDSYILLFSQDNNGGYKITRLNELHRAWTHYQLTEQGEWVTTCVTPEEAAEINKNKSDSSYCRVGVSSALIGKAIFAMDTSDATGISLSPGDIIILCSDGVTNALSDMVMINTIQNYTADYQPAAEVAYQIIKAVEQHATTKQDNASCIVFKVHQEGAR